MNTNIPILTINGSDSSGLSGIQSDIKTIKDLGGYGMSAITSVTIQNKNGISLISEMTTDLVVGQIRAVYEDAHPKAVKVGMINNAETIRRIRDEIIGCKNIIASPVVLASNGTRLMDDEAILALKNHILPNTKVLIAKCQDVEIVLNIKINTDDDMLMAAKILQNDGVEWIMLRGSKHIDGRVTALLYGPDTETHREHFFSSHNIAGWQKHGISGALSAAIATRLAMGDDVVTAIENAHNYLHSQIVYAADDDGIKYRPKELYNTFLSLIAEHYRVEHEVRFYADMMAITSRYLSQITKLVAGKSPKQIIDEYIMQESKKLLLNTSMPIQEVSYTLGFSSPILFSRFFHQREGVKPRDFRHFDVTFRHLRDTSSNAEF